MKKINLLIAAGLMASASMQAQTVLSFGFEDSDATGQSSQWAITPGLSLFGDWVNVNVDEDQWDEQYTEEVHSGNAALQAVNGEGTEQSYNRGFKIAGLNIEENTAYRVSMWVKGESGNRFTSWISKGIENFDKSICTRSGQNFGINDIKLAGGWQHLSFVTFYKDAQTMNDYIAEKESWRGDAVIPDELGGDGEKKYKAQFEDKLPEEFFFIANMFSNNAVYILDDIKIEKGVTFNQATFNGDVNAVKLDFGYTTNIAKLAKATEDGIALFDASCVEISIDGVASNDKIKYVEGHTDGFLYIFLDDEVELTEESQIVVGFKGEATILYDGDKRPSADYETEMAVLPFSGEVAYYDEELDAMSNEWIAPKFVKSVPEHESFEIESASFNNIAVTFNKPVDLSTASATLIKNGVQTDLTNGMTLSEDGKTVNVAVSNLADGEYSFILNQVTNEMGIDAPDVNLTFAVGPDNDQTISESVYSTNETFANTANGTFPIGWVANDNGTIHEYGINEDDGTIYNYNWGGHNPLNNAGGGTRTMTGYSGDLNGGAIYWRCMNGNNSLGTLTFGEQVKDYIDAEGNLDPEMPEKISLYLDPKKYQITIRMCAWKNLNGNEDARSEENAPKYNFTLEDLDGNVYARFDDVMAMPNVNGAQNASVTGVTRSQTDFTVEKAGYYMLKFSTTQPNGEYLLGGVDLITMPSKAAYWKQQLAQAVELYKPVLEDEAYGEMYDGDTKTALETAINNAEKGHFTSPSEIEEAIEEMKVAATAMRARIKNIDDFNQKITEAELAYYGEEDPNNPGEYLTEPIAGTKYANTESAKAVKEILDTYGTANPSDLSDETLAEVSPKIVSAAGKLAKVKDCTDRLTWRGYKAFQAADLFGVDGSAMLDLVTDDTPAIEQLNGRTTLALYEMLAANPIIPEEMMAVEKYAADQYVVVDGEYTAMTGEEEAARGIDLTCFVDNPKMYTTATTTTPIDDGTVKGWNCTRDNNNIQLQAAATEEEPVVTPLLNGTTGGPEYDFYQEIVNAPVGVYDVRIGTRTASQTYNNEFIPYNGMDDETGLWDKYIYVQVDNEEPQMVPFSIGSGWTGYTTVVRGVEVKEGSVLRIGVVEHYVSQKAQKNGEKRDVWDTNTFFTDARLYFAAPLKGYDYGQAATAVESVEALKAAKAGVIYNVAGQQVDENYKGIVIKADGTKKYQK